MNHVPSYIFSAFNHDKKKKKSRFPDDVIMYKALRVNIYLFIHDFIKLFFFHTYHSKCTTKYSVNPLSQKGGDYVQVSFSHLFFSCK